MSIFTEGYRAEVLEQITDFLKSCKSVLSVIVVGSGANGFRDQLSDIDLTVVVDDKTDTDAFLAEYQAYLNETFRVMINHRVPGRPLTVAMFDNFLEIDMSAVILNQLCAVKDSWRVVFDRTDSAEKIMQETFKSRLSADSSERKNNEYQVAAWGFWHYIIYASIAIRRNDLWRASWEMGYLRDTAIGLLGLEYGVETKRNRDVKLFPDEMLQRLQKTMPFDFNQETFSIALKNMTDLIYDILEKHFDKNGLEFPREKMIEFLEGRSL